MLIEQMAPTQAGRVVFSLQEIPMRVNFITPAGNRLQRVADHRLYVATLDGEEKCKLDISRTVSHDNKDQFLWGAVHDTRLNCRSATD